MGLNSVDFREIGFKSKNQTVSDNATKIIKSDYEKSPSSDKVEISSKTDNTTKAIVGLGAVGAIIALGILGRKGKLGSYIQELLGGSKKETQHLKESLEKLLEKHKNKTIKELTLEEKNKIKEALNPENKAEIKTQIEAEFEAMNDKKLSEVVDSIKNKLKGIKDAGNGVKSVIPENKPNKEVVEKPTTGSNKGSGSSSAGTSTSRGSSTSSSNRSGNAVSSRKSAQDEGTAILEAQEKEILEAKKASDARNNEWLKKQYEAKEKEYGEFWNKALVEREAKFDKEIENKTEEILLQLAERPNFCERTPKEISEELLSKLASHFETVNPAIMSEEAKMGMFLMSTRSGMKEPELMALVKRFGLDKVLEKTEESLVHNGKTVKAIFKNADGYILSDGSILSKESGKLELLSIDGISRGYEEAIKEVQTEMLKRTKLVEEGAQRYAEYNKHLDGKTTIRVNDKKSKELAEMGQYYHAEELSAASALRKELATQAERMKWFDSYLQDEPLRKALGVADDAKILYHSEHKIPYIKNQKGNILTYNRETGVWSEYNESALENWSKYLPSLSKTKNAEGMIVTRYYNQNNNSYEYFVRNLETGGENIVKDGKIYKKLNGKEEIQELSRVQEIEMQESFKQFFSELEPTLPKKPPYGSPKEPPAQFVTVKAGKKQKVLNDIEAYVRSFDAGTFQKVDKHVVIYNANGERETINIIYEGIDCDIDALGRILPKLKVDPKVRVSQSTISSSSEQQWMTQRKSQRYQRQKVHA